MGPQLIACRCFHTRLCSKYAGSRTWKEAPAVLAWEASKAAGNLITPYVHLLLHSTEGTKACASILYVGRKARPMAEMNVPMEVESAEEEEAEADEATDEGAAAPAADETRMQQMGREARERVEATRRDEAERSRQKALAKTPFAIQFALLASEPSPHSRPNLNRLASDENGRRLLAALSAATSQRDIDGVVEEHGGMCRLRVPSRRSDEQLVYTVVVGLDALTHDWSVLRYEGPFCHTASKWSRSLGSANLLLVRIEDPADDDVDDAGADQRYWALISALNDFLLRGLEVCGRRFKYLEHKVEHQTQDSKLLFVAVGSSVVRRQAPATTSSSSNRIDSASAGAPSTTATPPSAVGTSAAAADVSSAAATSSSTSSLSPPHWSCAGGSAFSWRTPAEARDLVADFTTLPPNKMAKRLQLGNSPCVTLGGRVRALCLAPACVSVMR